MSWASVPPAQVAVPTNATAVTFGTAARIQGNAAITANEVDYYSFTAPVSGSFKLETQTAIDTVLGLFDASGKRLAYNDDISNSNYASRTQATLTAGQKYFVGITNYNGTANGNYVWAFDKPIPDDQYEGATGNNTLATAANLGSRTTNTTIANLVMADSADWYKFTTTAAGGSSNNVSIAFQHAAGDLDLQLYNSVGTKLLTSDGTGNSETVSLNGLAAGTYYAYVYGYQGAKNSSYSLTINAAVFTPPPPPPPPPPTSSTYNIQFAFSGLTTSQQAIFSQAATKWQSVITTGLASASYNGQSTTGVIIDASAAYIDGVGNVLGQAGPDRFRSGTSLPYHGSMQFDSADLASMESNGSLLSVILHEMGHVLGIGTLWSNKGLLVGAGTSNPTFTGANAVTQYNTLFGTNVTGVPVENQGGGGTADAHWREATFGNELMTGYINSGSNPLSRVTVGSLADLGYTVNYAAADNYTPPGRVVAAASLAATGTPVTNQASVVQIHSSANLDYVTYASSSSSGNSSNGTASTSSAGSGTAGSSCSSTTTASSSGGVASTSSTTAAGKREKSSSYQQALDSLFANLARGSSF